MNEAIILHTIEDVKHCLKYNNYQSSFLFSTHSSVDIYMRDNCKKTCYNLSKFVTNDEIQSCKIKCSKEVDKILQKLDKNISTKINSNLGLKINYFNSLYSYVGKQHYYMYVIFFQAVSKIIKKFNLNKLIYYEKKMNGLFDVNTNLSGLMPNWFPYIETKVLKSSNSNRIQALNNLKQLFFRVYNAFLYTKKPWNDILNLLKPKPELKIRISKKTILVYGPLYDLMCLRDYFVKYNILYCQGEEIPIPVGFNYEPVEFELNFDFDHVNFINEKGDRLVQSFLSDIKESFLKNIYKYMSSILMLKQMNEKYHISCGIWGNPPLKGVKALVFSYLMSNNIRVIGAQHGNCYGDQIVQVHLDSDFNRCNYYISYGFTKEDLKNSYPNINIETIILPFGKSVEKNSDRLKETIDILFPIAQSISFFDGGMSRMPCDQLTERQEIILEYLDSLEGFNIHVKPMQLQTYQNCAMFPIQRKFRNLKVIDSVMLSQYLLRYAPEVVIIECASSPLYDTLHLDAEIFLIGDVVYPYEQNALEKLKKRVHYSNNVDEIIKKIDMYLKSKIPSKRDKEFYDHYVFKPNRKNNIIRFIDSCVVGV